MGAMLVQLSDGEDASNHPNCFETMLGNILETTSCQKKQLLSIFKI